MGRRGEHLPTTGHSLDVAARDAVMAVAAPAPGRLAQVHERARAAEPMPARRVVTAP